MQIKLSIFVSLSPFSPQLLVLTHHSVHMRSASLDYIFKCEHAAFVFLCLTFQLSEIHVASSLVVNGRISLLFEANVPHFLHSFIHFIHR